MTDFVQSGGATWVRTTKTDLLFDSPIIVPTARLLPSRVHVKLVTPRSSLDLLPFRKIALTGIVNV